MSDPATDYAAAYTRYRELQNRVLGCPAGAPGRKLLSAQLRGANTRLQAAQAKLAATKDEDEN
jgi:hypothetical protein